MRQLLILGIRFDIIDVRKLGERSKAWKNGLRMHVD